MSRYGRWWGDCAAGALREGETEGERDGTGSDDGAGDGVAEEQGGMGRGSLRAGKGESLGPCRPLRAAWPQFL